MDCYWEGRQNQILQKLSAFLWDLVFFYLGANNLKVLKAINNNVVSCVDEDGNELVVMGKGLGFRAKSGDLLPADSAEKIFRMDSPEEISRLKDLFSQLPPELLELCNRIIEHAKAALGRRLNESIYLTLTDHIQFALNRTRQGMDLPNPLLTEVRVFYPVEYAIGQYALDQIRSGLNVALGADEAASIALHLVNAEYDSSMNTTMRAAQVLKPMVHILENWPGLKLNHEHLFYDELIVHIKFMAMQAFSHEAEEWVGAILSQSVYEYLPSAYTCAGAITGYLTEKCGNAVPAAEQAYLAVCIHRACIS